MPTQPLFGPHGQLFAEQRPSPDETTFLHDNTSAAYYNSPYFLKHRSEVQPIPQPRPGGGPLRLEDFAPSAVMDVIASSKRISFHTVGDTGAAKGRAQTAIEHEASVADAMAADVGSIGPDVPAFFFHLGDVIYSFGEAQYYYDQFYEPFRDYDRPIFAVPGNHDGMVFGASSSAPQVPTLAAFLTNFCAPVAGPSPDSPSTARSIMTQPGVYFTLDCPFVSIIGLYTNVLDSYGVLSSQGGRFPLVDDQLGFLASELSRLKADHDAGRRAIILALHHPPLSADARHGGAQGLLDDIDACCQKAQVWPDAVLSGHAHLYQRFTRRGRGKETPYIVCGAGGYAATAPRGQLPRAPVTIREKAGWSHTMEIDPIVQFGYLTVTIDGAARRMSVVFKTAVGKTVVERDAILFDLRTDQLLRAAASSGGPARGKRSAPSGTRRSGHAKKPSRGA